MRDAYYIWLVLFTAGTLVTFFWLIVILGHRRQRNFERVLFFLCLALLLFYGASLLAVNARLYYGTPQTGLLQFCWATLCLGLAFVPALLVHLHVEYAEVRELLRSSRTKLFWLLVCYLPLLGLVPHFSTLIRMRSGFDFITPINRFGGVYELWLSASFLLSFYWQWAFAKIAPDDEQKKFHKGMRFELLFATLWVLLIYFQRNFSEDIRVGSTFVLAMFPLVPLGTLVRKVQKFNFLQIGRQRNLIYAVFLTFVALLYLSFVRRVSLWIEPTLPPEATAAILLFLPVVFFEPLQRKLRTALRRAAQGEIDVTQRMIAPIREVSRRGDTAKLIQFVEQWVAQQLELANVQLLFDVHRGAQEQIVGGSRGSVVEFPIKLSKSKTNKLRVTSHGAMLSGETWAAIEFLCEELPSIFDLCHLLEEKLQLERELAERERLALVGQTAASISHNLKNPLGSIKTILQVQLENPEMPESMRGETKMVLEEIGRLSTKLNQLLQFSRPAVRSGSGAAQCDARKVLVEAVSVLRPLAEERQIVLKVEMDSVNAIVAVPADVLNDIASNLLVNALEAVRSGGHVMVNGEIHGDTLSLFFDDDGPGIPESLREKILQPFFTTKSQGTGLGLAIVARRVAEYGGKLEWESPLKDAKGTRFKVILPIEEGKK